MKQITLVIALISVLSSGCAGPGPNGESVWVINLAPSPCEAAKQYTTNTEITAKYKDEIDLTGKTSKQKLVEYQDQVALLQNQSKAACDMLNRGRITFDQYQSEMREVRSQLEKMRSKVKE